MKEFEDFEKEIIKTLISLESSNHLNCFNNILQQKNIDFFNKPFYFYLSIPVNNDISIHTYEDLDNLSNEKLNEFTTYINKKLLIITDLFDYLEKNDYIVSTKGNFENPFILGNMIVGENIPTQLDSFVSTDKNDKLYNFADYARKIYYVRDKLKLLVKNDYLIESERKYQEQIELTQRGLKITIVALVISTIFNIWQLFKENSQDIIIKNKELKIKIEEPTQLSERQLKELLDNIKKIRFNIQTECYHQYEDDCLK